MAEEKKITKAYFVDALYEKTGMKRKDVHTLIDMFLDEIKDALIRRQVIELRGLGTFEVKIRKARSRVHNPRTGETFAICPHGFVVFRSGRELKQDVWNIGNDVMSVK
jgi:integration host factor subunit beta